jgi:WD40 repeat protein
MWSILRLSIISVAIGLAAGVLPSAKSHQAPNGVSLKLVQTLTESELVWTRVLGRQELVAVSTSDAVQLWDTRTHTLGTSLPKHKKLLDAFFSSDGSTFVTASKEKPEGIITRLWDAQTGRLKTTLSGLVVFGPVQQSCLTLVVTLGDHEELKFWNADTGDLQKTVTAYKRSFSDSIISPDGRLVVRYRGKKAFLWELATGHLIGELKPPQQRDYIVPWYHDIKIYGATFSPDSKIVATEDSLNSIQLWDTDTGRMRASLEGHGSTIYELAFSRDGKLLASASRDGTARLWDVETGRLRTRFEAGKEIAQRVQFDPTGTILAVGYHTQAKLWDVSSSQLIANLTRHADVNRLVLFGTYWDAIQIVMSPDGKLLLTIGDKSVKVWNTVTGNPVATLNGVHAPVAFSSDSKAIAATGRNKTVLVWSVE